jgi:hypothetical protein
VQNRRSTNWSYNPRCGGHFLSCPHRRAKESRGPVASHCPRWRVSNRTPSHSFGEFMRLAIPVGMEGFEPSTTDVSDRHSYQTELHPNSGATFHPESFGPTGIYAPSAPRGIRTHTVLILSQVPPANWARGASSKKPIIALARATVVSALSFQVVPQASKSLPLSSF